MRRREFVTLLGGAVATWPLAARAQQPALPVIGFLNAASSDGYAHYVAGFRQGLAEAGYIESQNVAIEYRWAEGQYERLPALAADLVHRQVAVIVANTPAAMVASAVTTTIPIVFSSAIDPVKAGLVASLNRPGGNITGVANFDDVLGAKRLELLRELVPKAEMIGLLINPNNPNAETIASRLQEAARTLGQQIRILNASTEGEVDAAFATLAELRIGAILVASDPFFVSRRDQIVALAARQALPAIYQFREFPVGGGLMSYGASLADAYRQLGVYTGKILKGAKPAELPFQQVVKVEMIIKLKTAKALGLTVPLSLLGRADEVIE
ncbi:MAG TPA: ABC transporter substrate-binding protein [Xanthobacteraceae bacterium]